MPKYVPDTGDVVWMDFDPCVGNEQQGNRPALVLSSKKHNETSNRMVCCPLTTRGGKYTSGYDSDEIITYYDNKTGKQVESIVLVDQIKSQDWKERHVMGCYARIPASELLKVQRKVTEFLELQKTSKSSWCTLFKAAGVGAAMAIGAVELVAPEKCTIM